MDSLKTLLKPLAEDGAQLTREQAADVLRQILAGEVPDVETAALLTVFATRGEQAPELAGFVDVMREQSVPVPLTDEERAELVDCVGTGGGGPLTFNISSGAALVAAAAGAKVAKHGNRAVTSRCGAADVLEALGVPIDLSPELAVECLRETGFVFLYAPLYHPAMQDARAAAARSRFPHHFESLWSAHQSCARPHPGRRRSRTEPSSSRRPRAAGSRIEARLCRTRIRWY